MLQEEKDMHGLAISIKCQKNFKQLLEEIRTVYEMDMLN